jgi:hypothetical protein
MAITRLGTYSQIKGSTQKIPCKVATTGNITLSSTQTIDSVSVVVGDRVLVWQQSTPANNGIYIVNDGSWTRAIDMSLDDDVFTGLGVYVNSGATYSGKNFVITTSNPIILGVTSLTFAQSAGGSGSSGSSGTSGTDGSSGSSGTSGTDGSSGSSGTSGIDGSSGSSGTSGIDGSSGSSGTSGTDGSSGSSGTSGTDGSSGSSGTSGIDGSSGSSGTSGTDGSSGSSGTSGS